MLRCSWSIACQCCSNFILDLTLGFNGLGKDNFKTGRQIFKTWDLVRLISGIWRYVQYPVYTNNITMCTVKKWTKFFWMFATHWTGDISCHISEQNARPLWYWNSMCVWHDNISITINDLSHGFDILSARRGERAIENPLYEYWPDRRFKTPKFLHYSLPISVLALLPFADLMSISHRDMILNFDIA